MRDRQDGIEPDVALSARHVRECIETCDALFRRGGIFEVGNAGFYTGLLLGGVIRRAARGAVASTGWPASVNDADLAAGRAYATSLCEMAVEFFKANFPDYSWRHCFAAFDCSTKRLADRTRVRLVRRLAGKEGVSIDEAALAFKAALPHMARHFRDAGNDNRRAWQNYVEESLRERRGRPAIKAVPCASRILSCRGAGPVENPAPFCESTHGFDVQRAST